MPDVPTGVRKGGLPKGCLGNNPKNENTKEKNKIIILYSDPIRGKSLIANNMAMPASTTGFPWGKIKGKRTP